MGNLFFSPSGRIGPGAYMKGMLILGVIGAVINLLPLVSIGLAMIVSVLSLVLIIPFIFMSIKRAHDSGKSGWFSIVAIIIGIVISLILGMVVAAIGLGAAVDQEAVNAAAEAGDLGAVMDAAGGAARAAAIPSAITNLIGAVATAFVFNMINKQDMGDNQYGPVPPAA